MNYELRELHELYESIVFFELWGLNYELRELHESLSLIRDIRVIRSFLVYELTSLRVNKLFVAIMIRGIRVIRSPNLFYIFGQEKVWNRIENQLFCHLCKYFVIK